MKNLINYFNSAPDFHRVLLLSFSFFLFWNIEYFYEHAKNKVSHLWLNAKFMLTAAPVQFVLGYLMNFVLKWTQNHEFGLFHQIQKVNALTLFILTFLYLDFCEYAYHLLMHKVKKLWKFHLVHHADKQLDVSTTLREHPGETTIRLLFTTLWVFLGGVSLWALIFRQFIQIFSNVLAHTEVRLPEKVDSWLSYLFVTPNFHHVHHHYLQPYTDTNYGDVLSIWDRIFGTFAQLPKEAVVFGVDTHFDECNLNTFSKLLTIPLISDKSSVKINMKG
ncbi:fatty acid hydroxylase [Emticicia oligotrophica DSM 17448]|uniref:Fatty acid hydroxylase n=1 Tax=Emticicia oligotrophica (strain DSM 17448 / CIP 109782 / MTCC 6937 / GPTSA100-15) TaxID=929562 RepID=A0ABN4ASU5_EMTOG|nr:sterol desaturase family protein [Emticicia oligotrophica]AFK04915.1 fatty acid hydroxylase [Emticicia oligotrophica DSM 17448]